MSLDNIQSKNPINWTGQNLLGKALMDIREKFRGDMALLSEATITAAAESSPTQKVVRRRKPAFAAAQPAIEAAQPDAELQPINETVAIQPVTAPVAAAAAMPSVGPRTIRRRPQVAAPVTASTQLEPITINKI